MIVSMCLTKISIIIIGVKNRDGIENGDVKNNLNGNVRIVSRNLISVPHTFRAGFMHGPRAEIFEKYKYNIQQKRR